MKKLTKKSKTKTSLSRIFVLLIIGFILRIILANWGTVALDQNTFIAWGRSLAINGPAVFYKGWSDYLPGYLYVLWAIAQLEKLFPFSLVLLYKLPAILGDILTAFFVYKIVLKKSSEVWARIAACFILFNPAVLYNSTLWGQIDVLTALLALASLYFAEVSWPLTALLLALGAVVKPQAALAAIVVASIYLVKRDYKKLIYVGVTAAALSLVFFIPFSGGTSIVSFALSRISVTLNQYQYTSVNAFNFWGLFGFWKNEGTGVFNSSTIGLILFAIPSVFAFKQFLKGKISKYHFLAILFSANFLFFTRMHERHFLPAIILLVASLGSFPLLVFPVIAFSIVYVLNMRYAQVWIIENFKTIFPNWLVAIIIVFCLASFTTVCFPSLLEKVKRLKKLATIKTLGNEINKLWRAPMKSSFKTDISTKKARKVLLGILAFALITRLIGLSEPTHEYFDEVYHAFTARQILHGNQKAWEWWNENPAGFAYEWTHPPVAKLGMVIGMLLFGESSFGWRIPQALLGTATVYLVYALSDKMFKNKSVSLLAAALFSLDGLALVMSRIGMNDTYVVFFLLASLLLFLNDKLFFCAIALGLALASKWTTFWFFPIIVGFMFLYKKKINMWYAFFALVPVVYIASYFLLFSSGHSFEIFWGMQKQMWWYHTGLVATHPFSSPWWSWPFMLRPLWLYTGGEANGMTSNIYAMGNPIIFWGGVIAVLLSIFYIFKDRSKPLLAIVGAYLGLFIPWAVSPRIMFLYHYFPSVPFLCIVLAYVLMKNKRYVWPFLFVSLIVFVYFYPRLTGIPVPIWLNNSYYWLPSWR